MWCPEEYVPLSVIGDVFMHEGFDWVYDNLSNRIDDGDIADAGWAYRRWYLTMFFSVFREDIRACVSSGAVVRLDSSVFMWTYPNDDNFDDELSMAGYEFPNKIELIKRIFERRFCFIDEEYLTLLRKDQPSIAVSPFYPLEGAALCIHRTILPASEERLSDWVNRALKVMDEKIEADLEDGHPKGIAEKIVEAYRTGAVKRKDDAKRLFGRGMKTDVWKAVWKEAVAINPRLSRSGPR